MLLLASFALAQPYALAEAGLTFDLPAGWEMTRWSDWDFRASHPAGLAMEQWYTGWQLPVDVEVAKGFSAQYVARLDEQRAGKVATVSVTPARAGTLAYVHTVLSFQFDGGTGPRGEAHVATFAGDGKVVHVAVYAAATNGPRAAAQLDTLLARMSLDKPPADVAALGGTQSTPVGVKVALPAGWRVPLPSEAEEVRTLSGATGATTPEACFTAARPAPEGGALMLLCQAPWTLGLLDEHSFPDLAPRLVEGLFGKAASKVAPPELLDVADHPGFLVRPEINDHDLRVGVVPYDRGALMGWVVGPPGSGATLEAALVDTVRTLGWEGPDGGKPQLTFGEKLTHVLSYEPFHPGVLCCGAATLAFLGGIGTLVFRRKPPPPAY